MFHYCREDDPKDTNEKFEPKSKLASMAGNGLVSNWLDDGNNKRDFIMPKYRTCIT